MNGIFSAAHRRLLFSLSKVRALECRGLINSSPAEPSTVELFTEPCLGWLGMKGLASLHLLNSARVFVKSRGRRSVRILKRPICRSRSGRKASLNHASESGEEKRNVLIIPPFWSPDPGECTLVTSSRIVYLFFATQRPSRPVPLIQSYMSSMGRGKRYRKEGWKKSWE